MTSIPSAPAQWQPIETAPKDGTAILAFWRSRIPDAVVTGQNYAVTRFDRGCWVSMDDPDASFADPAYWMHLPTPPEPWLR